MTAPDIAAIAAEDRQQVSGNRQLVSDHAVILPLEGLAGSSVQDVAKGMIAAAKRFNMPVSLGMNGTRLLAFPNSTLAELRRDYEAQLPAAPTEQETARGE